MLGRAYSHTTQKAQSLLGWKPRPMQETVLDAARWFEKSGLIKSAST